MDSDVQAGRERLLIGLRLKDVRAQLNCSLEAFALQLGLSPSHLCNMERGHRLPSTGLLIRLGRDYDVNLDYLLLGRTDAPQGRLRFRTDEELLAALNEAPRRPRWRRV